MIEALNPMITSLKGMFLKLFNRGVLPAFFFLVMLTVQSGFAQVYLMDNTDITVCEGQFTDDGPGGTPYTDTNYIMTICPGNPGDAISVEFVAFALQQSPNPNNSDYLAVYDGDNTGANSLGSYTGSDLVGITVTASVFNPTGCLTFQFISNTGNTQGFPGWSGLIECTTPCAAPTSVSEILDPAPSGPDQTIGVCLNEPITFADNGSFAEAGFTLENYIWNFDDGSVDSLSGPEVTHSFDQPGEYIVTLTVEDNNGCQSLNVQPLQVLVSTLPEFNTDWEDEICLGTTTTLDGTPLESVTWTALPPQVFGGEFYLADGPGFSFENSIIFDFFEPGAVLEDCSDLESITLNMEHSYLGDLNIAMTCPDGTTVVLVEYPNGGGSTFLGEPIDNDQSDEVGVGYSYGWAPDANNGTWGDNAGGFGTTLAEGLYESDFDLCDFVGCPLNGEWTLSIIDNLASDDGTIFEFGVNFNPELFPDVTTFTPIYGEESDSSFWEGPYISDITNDSNTITVLPEEEGVFEYTYYATNNFGCTLDTTVTVTVTAAPQVFANDLSICEGGSGSLVATLDEDNPPLCSDDSGDYVYCYTNGDNTTFTYCPDNPGDGVTFMGVTFTVGQVENFFDELTFYDGDDATAPIITVLQGDLAGQSVFATNPSGCITMVITSDGSVSCESGSYPAWEYSVGCASGLDAYTIEWSPGTYLESTSIPNPEVIDAPNGEYGYQVELYPIGFPECATSDSATVFISGTVSAGDPTQVTECFGDVPFNLFNALDGNPDAGGEWIAPDESLVDEEINLSEAQEGEYRYVLVNNGCPDSTTLQLDINTMFIEALADTTVCINGTASFSGAATGDDNDNLVYFWSGSGGDASGPDYSFVPTSNPSLVQLYATYGDGCITDTTQAVISQYSPLSMDITNPETVCLEDEMELEVFNPTGGFGDYEFNWTGDDGSTYTGNPVNAEINQDTEFCVVFNDGCETDPIEDCVVIGIEPIINAYFEADTLEGCTPIFVQFTGFAEDPSIVSSVVWDFGDGTVSNELNFTTHFYESPGEYDVSLTYTSIQGCVYDSIRPEYIYSFPNPDAQFSVSPQVALLPNSEFDFNNTSFGAVQADWTFGQFGTSQIYSPDFEFPVDDAQVIPVQLIATNQFGCADTVVRNVIIQEDFLLFVPNAFTPDGDGLNDLFFVEGQDINRDEYNIQIFNRWGEMVFESDNPDQPWDGSHENGEYFVQEEVYVWRIETRSLSTAEKKEFVGHVTVIR